MSKLEEAIFGTQDAVLCSLLPTKREPSAKMIGLDKVEVRCPFCGSPEFNEVQERGHYETTCCRQVTEGCCNGETAAD